MTTNTNKSTNPDYSAISKEDIGRVDNTIKKLGIENLFNKSFTEFVNDELKKEDK